VLPGRRQLRGVVALDEFQDLSQQRDAVVRALLYHRIIVEQWIAAIGRLP